MPPALTIPVPAPMSAGPKSAAALDFESKTWQTAVSNFRMLDHKEKRVEEFLKSYSTPQAVSQTLRERQREAPTQYGPVLSKVLGKIDIFLAAGDIAVKGAPESVGLAWTGISLALGSIQDDFATFQLFSGACVDIIGILVTCRLFGRLFETPKGPPEFGEIQDQVLATIPKVYAKILEFSYQMFKYMDRNKFLRITRGILKNNKEEFAGGIKDIKDGERLLSDNATKASQALTSFWQERSDDNQKQMMKDLKQIQDKLSESTAASKEMNDYLKKELEEQRRKTPMDVARETQSKNKQNLRAIVDTEGMLSRRQGTRGEGTCKWIFDTDEYKMWHDSPGGSLLWVSGGGNMGKSVLVSSIIDQLREEVMQRPDELAHYFFCKSGDDNAQKTDRIMDHLLYFVYDLVPMSLEPLDHCNDLVRQYLAGRTEGRSRKRAQQANSSDTERILYFEDAFPRVAVEFKKKIYLIVDALDECTDRREEEFVQRLAAMAQRDSLQIKILITSRPEPDISEAMDKCKIPEVRMAKYNEGDIFRSVGSQLEGIPGMTSKERTTARDEICRRAGPYFGYLNPALELLRRPWQRPIEVHLKQLPENLQNMNTRIFQTTDPSYIGFLKTCLTWVILANGEQKMKISELIDIYSNRFLVEHSSADEVAVPEELNEEVTAFYKQMLRKTGEAFLDLDEKSKELNLIKPALVKDSFLKTNEQAEEIRRRYSSPDDCQCKACLAMNKQQSNFVLTNKYGHLEIATQIFEHLNSPLFQQMYLQPEVTGILPEWYSLDLGIPEKNDEETNNDEKNAGDNDDTASVILTSKDLADKTNGDEADKSVVDDSKDEKVPEPGSGVESDQASASDNTASANMQQATISSPEPKSDVELDNTSNLEQASGSVKPVITNGQVNGESENTAEDQSPGAQPTDDPNTTEQKDGEEAEVASNADSDVEGDDTQPQYSSTANPGRVFPRYEISQAMYHLQKVEEEWLSSEVKPEEYEKLYEDVIKFFEPKSTAFAIWRWYEINRPGAIYGYSSQLGSVSPLHLAAANGLVELSRRLIKQNGGDLHKIESGGSTPLSWAARILDEAKRYEICKLLLEKGAKSGTDALLSPDGSSADNEPPFHSLMYYGVAEPRLVQLFLDHGAKADEKDAWGYNSLHQFAWSGKDPAVLDMLVAAGADVNVEDGAGERPLHKFLNSRGESMPMDVLKRFLYHNADISAPDKYGQQALFEVAQGGNVEALKLILERKPDIDHQDEEKWTALHNAARYGNFESCKILCEASADPAMIEKKGCMPAYHSCYGEKVELLDYLADLLLQKDGKLLNHQNVDGKTILRKAAALGKTEMVKLLITKYREYIEIDVPDTILEWTPLHIAAYQGSKDIVELLLDHGADLECKDKKGKTALVLCYQQWELLQESDSTRNLAFENCLMALIEADRKAAVAETHLLSAAARKGSIAVLDVLVMGQPGQPKADPVLRDEFGWTAIELAKQYKRQLAVDFLQQNSGLTGRYPDAWVITKSEWTKWDADLREIEYIKELEEGGMDWDQRVTILADVPIPANLDRYYFEITIEFPDPAKAAEEKHPVGIGVFSLGASKWSKGSGLEWSFPGHADSSKRGIQSWGYHGDDGWVGSSLVGYYDPIQFKTVTYGHGDTVGCGVDFRKGYVFFVKNGERLMEKAFEDIQGRLTPAIGLLRQVKIRTAFTKPFRWKYGDNLDFDADIPAERKTNEPSAPSDPVSAEAKVNEPPIQTAPISAETKTDEPTIPNDPAPKEQNADEVSTK